MFKRTLCCLFVRLHFQYFMDPSVHTLQQWKLSPAANLSWQKTSSNPSARDDVPDKSASSIGKLHCVFVSWNRFVQPLFGPLRCILRNPDKETQVHRNDVMVKLLKCIFSKIPNKFNNNKTAPLLSPRTLLAFGLYLVHNLVSDLPIHLAYLVVIGPDRGADGEMMVSCFGPCLNPHFHIGLAKLKLNLLCSISLVWRTWRMENDDKGRGVLRKAD